MLFFILLTLILSIGAFFFYWKKESVSQYIPEKTILYLHYKNSAFFKDKTAKSWLPYITDFPCLNQYKFQEIGWAVLPSDKDENIFPFLGLDEIGAFPHPSSTELIILKGPPIASGFSDKYFKKQVKKNGTWLSRSEKTLSEIRISSNSFNKHRRPFNWSDLLKIFTSNKIDGFVKIGNSTYPLNLQLDKEKIKFWTNSGKKKPKTKEEGAEFQALLWQFIKPTPGAIALKNIYNLPQPNIVYKKDKDFIVIYQTKEDIEKIKARIQSYLAKKYPKKEKVILPDKTTAYELIPDPNVFQFKKCKEEKMYCIQKPEMPLEIGLKKEKEYLIVSNNLSFLEDSLKNADSPEQILFLSHLKKQFKECLYRPSEEQQIFLWFRGEYPLEYILANNSGGFISGCIAKKSEK